MKIIDFVNMTHDIHHNVYACILCALQDVYYIQEPMLCTNDQTLLLYVNL